MRWDQREFGGWTSAQTVEHGGREAKKCIAAEGVGELEENSVVLLVFCFGFCFLFLVFFFY